MIGKCKVCNKKFSYYPSSKVKGKFCSNKCHGLFVRGKNHPWWKGGKSKNGDYILIYCPEHPFAIHGTYVPEHRLVMEKFLGRYLESWEQVHHKDGNKENNKIENLQLYSEYNKNIKIKCPKCGHEF